MGYGSVAEEERREIWCYRSRSLRLRGGWIIQERRFVFPNTGLISQIHRDYMLSELTETYAGTSLPASSPPFADPQSSRMNGIRNRDKHGLNASMDEP
ncbi:hypothetical protein ONZ45_g9248 [Pleurotus djamor]|nr:hypothetical protein ONZ45_g9248 [Pleurotus djamor]